MFSYKPGMLKCSDPARPQVYPLGQCSPQGPQALKYPPQLQLWPQGDHDGHDDDGYDDNGDETTNPNRAKHVLHEAIFLAAIQTT